MKLELTTKQFRRLLDMAYIGNWILNSTRGDDRFKDYDDVESLLFAKAREEGMGVLAEDWQGEVVPSRAFAEGGIHEAIMEYENNVFFDILAEAEYLSKTVCTVTVLDGPGGTIEAGRDSLDTVYGVLFPIWMLQET